MPHTGRIAGWGLTDFGTDEPSAQASVMQFADIPIYDYLDPFVAENWVSDYLPEFIATGSLDPPKGASSGDSGGPLLIPVEGDENWIVAGIDSWGASSNSDQAPFSMFTDVSLYSDWIDEVVGQNKWKGFEWANWNFDTGIFDEVGESGLPAVRVRPFGLGKARSLFYSSDLKNWQAFEFLIGSFNSYQWNEDGSFTLYPGDWDSPKKSIFFKYEEMDQLVSGSGPLPMRPYQVVRGLSPRLSEQVFGQNQTIFKLEDLVAGRRYHLGLKRNEQYAFSFDLYQKIGSQFYAMSSGLKNLGSVSRPFTAGGGSEYWIAISTANGGYGYEMYLQADARVSVASNDWHEGKLETGDYMYRRNGVLMDAYSASTNISGDVKIEVESEFDAEMGIYDRNTGRQIGYYDQGAENDLESFIVYGEDLQEGEFRIFNFDHGVYGSYRFRYFPISEKSTLTVGTDERRAITERDRSSTNEENETRYYEFIEIENPGKYSSITITVDALGASVYTGLWDYDLNDFIETDFGGYNSHTFNPELTNRYMVYVGAIRGQRNVNYHLKVEGIEVVDDPEDPENGDPINLGEKRFPFVGNSGWPESQLEELPRLPRDFRD